MPQLLIETSTPVTFQMVEAKQGGKVVARGEFGRCDVPTANGRIYPTRLMTREIKRLSEDLKARRVLGETDHPTDGKTSLKRVSHVITDLWLESDGRVIGEAEVLNTTEGRNLKALIEAGIPLPVSSRGFGSTKPTTGKVEGEEVQEDFVLKTYDFVADPAVRTAVPTITMESVDDPTAAALFLAEFPDVAAQLQEQAVADAVAKAKDKVTAGVDAAVEAAEKRVRAEMTEAFEQRLATALVEAREDLGTQLREEFAADPGIGAAKATLAAIAEMVGAYRANPDEKAVRDAIKAKELEVAERTQERDEAVEQARQARLLLIAERHIGGTPVAEAMRALLVGMQFTDEQDVEAKLTALQESLPEAAPGLSEAEVGLREENATLRGTVGALEEKVASLDDKLKRAVELGQRVNVALKEAEARTEEAEQALEEARTKAEAEVARVQAEALEAYKVAKVARLANGRAVLGLMEDVTSQAEVDEVVAKHGRTEVMDGELREMRRRLQRGYGDEPQALSEERGDRTRGDRGAVDHEVGMLGTSMETMRKMAGLLNR